MLHKIESAAQKNRAHGPFSLDMIKCGVGEVIFARSLDHDTSPVFLGCRFYFTQHHANISAWWGKLFAAHAFFKESQKAVFIPRSRFYWVKLLFRKK